MDIVECVTCGKPTPFRGTRHCTNCWEIEGRIREYLGDEADNRLNDLTERAGCTKAAALRRALQIYHEMVFRFFKP